MSLSGAGSHSVVALAAGKPLHTHGLVDNNGATLFLCSGIASTGRDVTGDVIRLTQAAPLTGGFRLRVASNETTAASAGPAAGVTGFNAPVPVPGDAPVPVDRLRPGNTNVFPMTGAWRFRLDHGVSPAVRGELPSDASVPDFASPEASDAGWTNIPVPANWEIEGFSALTFQERPATSHDIGLYRRMVEIPATFTGKTVLWHFDGAYDGAEVFVNGQRCGYHESGFTAFNIDVTKALKPGQRNLFAVRLYKDTSSASLDHGDFWVLGGIYRETYLVALPPLHVEDVAVVTDLDEQYKDASLKSTVRVAGPAGAHFLLTCEMYSLDGARIALPAMSQSGDIGGDGSATVSLSAPVTAPKLWSAEKPNLYYVFYRLSDGNRTVVERVQDRIGFRKLENKGGVQLLNGVPVKYTGICRMEEFTPYGHALNEECWKTDIILMKADNINAIRLSHYDHSERFMELCDEAGFYLLDEIPACWIASEVRNASRTWAYVARTKETMDRDKNRPSVIAWACGNESGYGVNNQAMFDYAKAHDSTRPAFISQQNQGQNPRTDFEDYHYPSLPATQKHGQPEPRQNPRHRHRAAFDRCRRSRGDQLLEYRLARRQHRRLLHLGMAGPGHVRQVPRTLGRPRPRPRQRSQDRLP